VAEKLEVALQVESKKLESRKKRLVEELEDNPETAAG
jgi:hypothetical protein